jgi:glycosyltransferase involved in cell wall biosynthesis
MRILVLPRDPNPYQGLLYGEMDRLGIPVSYLGELTGSRTLNVLLLPAELLAHRMTGQRVIHLHWVFAFALPGAQRSRMLRRLAQAWFMLWLRACRVLGMRLVWTAHNVLPHEPVFADDAAARRALARACHLVVAHSPAALDELAALGAVARRSVIIQHGPFPPGVPAASLRVPGSGGGPRRFLFFGRVQPYKATDDLLAAFLALPGELRVQLVVAGQCGDHRLRARLEELAGRQPGRIVLRLERVPEDEVAGLMAAADVVVLPSHRVTTSGSALLALSHARPLIVPDIPGLADLPAQAVLRYDGGAPGLAAALARLARADSGTLAAMSAAALEHAAARTSWREMAEQITAEVAALPRGPGSARPRLPLGTS